MQKYKNSARHYKPILPIIFLSFSILLSMQFPVQFIGEFYQWTNELYLVVAFFLIAYAVWAFRFQRIKYLAVILIFATVCATTFNITEFNRSFVHHCEPINQFTKTCKLLYTIDTATFPDGTVGYLTLDDFPLGIQIWKQAINLLILF